jgi:hypothetical protein
VRFEYSSTNEAMTVFSTSVGHVTGLQAKKRRRKVVSAMGSVDGKAIEHLDVPVLSDTLA